MAESSLTIQHLIAEACEQDLLKYGDSFRGVGYTKSAAEAAQRYGLMLGVVREVGEKVSLLDFGCGLAHMLDYIEQGAARGNIEYTASTSRPDISTPPKRDIPMARSFRWTCSSPTKTYPTSTTSR